MENNQIQIFDENKIKLLKNTICKGATDDEFQLFLHACERARLDPFMKQIHAIFRNVKNKETGKWERMMTIQTSVDGFRLIAERTGNYSPGREPTYLYDEKGILQAATAYVKKRTSDGMWHEVAATAFFEEYAQKDKDGQPTHFWSKMKHNQLAKCAESLALRKAFPADLSGIYTNEEMEQADLTVIEVAGKKPGEESATSPPQEPILCISPDQVEELKGIIKECDPAVLSRLLGYYKIKRLEELSDKEFEKAKITLLRNKESWAAKQKLLKDFEEFQNKKEEVYA